MPKRENGLMDSVFNEFVFTAIYKSSYEQKRLLPDRYLKIAMNERLAKKFSAEASNNEKEIMLTGLGYNICRVINGNDPKVKLIQDVLSIPVTAKRARLNKVISESGLFVTTDKNILRTLGLMSDTIHHPSYYMDMEILRQGYHINKWSKKFLTEKDHVYREVDELARQIAKLFFNSALVSDTSKEMLGVTSNELKILLALYSSNVIQPTDEEFRNLFHGKMSFRSFADSIRKLMAGNFIHRLSGEISITALGIKKVNNFMKRVIHSNNF